MALITQVGRRSTSTRLIYALIYSLLLLGAITILYPFGLMVSTSLSSNADYYDFRIWPRYLTDDWELYRKYLVEKDKISELALQYGNDQWTMPWEIKPAALREMTRGTPEQLKTVVEDWRAFLKECPEAFRVPFFAWTGKANYSVLSVVPAYQRALRVRYRGDLEAANRAHDDTMADWSEASPPFQDPLSRRWVPPRTAAYRDWQGFTDTLGAHQIKVVSLEDYLVTYLRRQYINRAIINARFGTDYRSLSEIRWEDLLDGRLRMAADEREKVIRRVPLNYIELRDTPGLRAAFAEFAQTELDRRGLGRSGGPGVPFCPTVPQDGVAQSVWAAFVDRACPLEQIGFRSPLQRYRELLLARYGDLEHLNRAHGSRYETPRQIAFPYPAIDYGYFSTHKGSIRWRFAAGNYATVLRELAVRGRALWVTLLLVSLSVAGALTINPLAAYALSRYRLPYTHRVILFFLVTMAFPASVTMIPGFLLLKELNLLNTIWALVLPGLANGFAIFLLKGFFDSLPPELYEAAMIDGASEKRMFWTITLPMTKPILAVIGLGAFTAAYGAFMFAFLTCQNPKWWTVMVFLYEFQQTYGTPLVMASLVVASVPTLLAFLACQKFIMRGIVIPTFK